MLTRDDVMALSERDLDIAVAEKVLGHRVIHFGDDPPYGWDHMFEGDTFVGELPEYSSDWDAMGALWVEMARRGWHPLVMDNDGERIVCGYERRDGKYRQHSVDVPGVPDIPDGAAKAALLAVLEETHLD